MVKLVLSMVGSLLVFLGILTVPSWAHEMWAATSHETSPFLSPKLDLKKPFILIVDDSAILRRVWLSRHEDCEVVDVQTKIIAKEKHMVTVEAIRKNVEEMSMKMGKELFVCTDPKPDYSLQKTIRFDPEDEVNMLYVIVYIGCICLSCLFTGLNLALLSLDVETLEMVKNHDENPKKRQFAEDILPIRRDPNLMICTIILGNTMCNVLSTLVFGHLTNNLEVSFWQQQLLVVVVPTVILLVVSEIMPQIICTKYAMPIGARLQHVMRFFTVLMFPVAKALGWALDYLVGKETIKSTAVREIARFAHRKDKMAMVVNNTLELRKRTAKDVMTPMARVKKISDKEIVDKKMRESLKTSHTRMPVYKDSDPNHFYGVFNVKDLLLIEDSPFITVGTVMKMWTRTTTCRFVPAAMPVPQLMIELKTCSSLAFVTEYIQNGSECRNVTIGIVTLEDMLEEIIGEIYDEKDLRRVATTNETATEQEDSKQSGKKIRRQSQKKKKDEPLLENRTQKGEGRVKSKKVRMMDIV